MHAQIMVMLSHFFLHDRLEIIFVRNDVPGRGGKKKKKRKKEKEKKKVERPQFEMCSVNIEFEKKV